MNTTALLVMDVQRGIVERFADNTDYLPRLSDAIDAARVAGIPVVYVTIHFRPGYPEISPGNATFSAVSAAGRLVAGSPDTEIHPAVAPGPQDVVVVKRRVSAFTGSDLDVVLRGLGADSLVLTGIATSGVVLSTLRQAADLDYRLTVLSDACLDADPEVHRVLTEKVFPRQAAVQTVTQWARILAYGDTADLP
jgi:nicotinamidase-related amidase